MKPVETVLALKQEIATHFDKSHKTDFGCFLSDIPLREFEDITIVRIRDKKQIVVFKEAVKNPHFWHTFRNLNVLAEARA